MRTEGVLSLHFEGDIVLDHKVSARTLGKSITHLQNAIDRAYIDIKYGALWKHARMKGEDYIAADFIALYPAEGGFIQQILSDSGKKIVDRISKALEPAVEKVLADGEGVATNLHQQVQNRKGQISHGIIEPEHFLPASGNADNKITRAYADRAINRELDQILSIIRSPRAGESFLEIEIYGEKDIKYPFDKNKSARFHDVISRREIGEPMICVAKVRQLDRGRLTGKIINLDNDKTATINFANDTDFLKVHPFLGNNQEMTFLGAPVIEYGAFDPNSGDIYFIDFWG